MAIIWMDGFDHWQNKTEMGDAYVLGSPSTSSNLQSGANTPFTYGQCYAMTFGATQAASVRLTSFTLQSDEVLIHSLNVWCNQTTNNGARIQFLDGSGNVLAALNFDMTDGSIAHYTGNNGTLVAQSSGGVISASTWHWVEMKIKFAADTTGYIVVKVGNTEVLNVTGIQTRTGSLPIGRIVWRSFAATMKMDDIYLMDSAGDDNNDFIGPSRILTQKVAADGAETDWLPTPDTYQNIDEDTSDADVTFIYSTAGGSRATFDIEALPYDPAEIHAVQAVWRSRKTDAGARTATCGIISGATDDPGPAYASTTSYVTRFEDMHEVNPDTSLEWDRTAVEALQIVLEDTTA